jgi:hypothetical protein
MTNRLTEEGDLQVRIMALIRFGSNYPLQRILLGRHIHTFPVWNTMNYVSLLEWTLKKISDFQNIW